MNNSISKTKQTSQVERPQKAARLKRYLLILLVILPSFAIFSALFFSNVNNEIVLAKEARVLLKNTTEESMRQTQDFLKTAEVQASLSAAVIQKSVISANDIQTQENYFVSQLQLHPNTAGMYVANKLGSFFYVSRSMDITKGQYRSKHIDRDTGSTKTEIWWRNDEAGNTAISTEEVDDFDPRMRPWYQKSVADKALIWTDPYIFFTTQKLGITTAVPIVDSNGDVLGAIGVDVELTELADSLGKMAISHYGSSFIIDGNGVLIATPALQKKYAATGNEKELELLNIQNSDDELAKLAYKSVIDGYSRFGFDYENGEYMVETMPLSVSGGKNWRIVTYAEKNEFLPDLRKSDKQNYSLAGIITILSILLGWYVANITWRPVVEMENNANYDPLTLLFNRRFLLKRANTLISAAIVKNQPLSVVMIDIDNFKQINDNYGHTIGDKVIKIFANRLLNQQRQLDIAARYGGEEFVLILPNTTLEVAKSVIENARLTISSRLYDVDDYILKVTFSAGIASLTDANQSFKDILAVADKAMYISKQNGRDRVTGADEISGYSQ